MPAALQDSLLSRLLTYGLVDSLETRAGVRPETLVTFESAEAAAAAAAALDESATDWRFGARARHLRPSRKAKPPPPPPPPPPGQTVDADEPSSAEAEAEADRAPRGRRRGGRLLREHNAEARQQAPSGPKGPDGTRGFTLGRGRARAREDTLGEAV
jgi:hypothetical protein